MASSVVSVSAVWEDVGRQYEASSEPYLLYWRGVLAQCLGFEDAPAGVEAALAAGMMVVGLPDPAMDPALLAGATLIAPSLSDVPFDEIGNPG